MTEAIQEATAFQRFVLLSVLELDASDATPVYSFDVYDQCVDRLDDLPVDHFGGVTRGDVIDALARLHADGLLDERRPDEESPVGKGRPSYTPAVDVETALEALAEDAALSDVVDEIRE